MHAHITDDIEWKLTYVGSAESDQHDQELDSVLVGPMQVGGYKIVFQADPPDPTRIPPQDLLGVTVVLLSCFYKDREFIRVGYYVNNEYDTPELKRSRRSSPSTTASCATSSPTSPASRATTSRGTRRRSRA